MKGNRGIRAQEPDPHMVASGYVAVFDKDSLHAGQPNLAPPAALGQ